jgi:hypothetical protein
VQNFFFVTQRLLNREFSRFSASLFLAATLAVLAGCGSGGAGGSPASSTVAATTPTSTTPTGTPAASIQLLASSPQLASSGASTVDLTAVVLSATKQAVSGRTVTFSTGTDTTAFVNNISASGVSDLNGLVTAKLNIGSDKANRTITLGATADAATATNTVDVTGTTVTISGSSSLAFGAATTLTFTVKDSTQTALPNMTVTVTSKTGNTIVLTPTTGITNNSGQITAVVTAANAGNDTITATAAGAGATQALTISPDSFAFTTPTLVAPATSIDIPLNTATATSVNWKNAGVAQAGKTVTFATSRGAAGGTNPSTTNAAGDTPGVTVSSATAGPAIITASGPGGTPAATLNVVFVATTASSVTTQAVPGTIQVTTGSASQATNSSTVSVLVRDAANNLVKNAGVNFTITADPSGGSLTAARAITDVTGSASVTYKAGATSSPSNGVTIQATVTDINGTVIAPVTGTTNLTVAGQSLLVRLGTDNLVVSNSPAPTYSKTYAAVVTDAAGNPVVGTTVRFALRPGRFQKGFYIAPTPFVSWVKAATPTTCPNEDTNFNGIIDFPAEDTNGNGQLDPGGSAIVNASAVTDANGVANAVLTYPKDHATWAEVILEARTGVVGNDPPALVTFSLPGLAIDYADPSIAPPGQTSPYGAGVAPNNVCSNTR